MDFGGLHPKIPGTLASRKVYNNPGNVDQVLLDGATIFWDMDLGGIATVTLTAAGRTMAAPYHLVKGTYLLYVVQDASGSRTITTWNAIFKWPLAVVPVLSTAANSKDLFSFVSDGTNMYGSLMKGMA